MQPAAVFISYAAEDRTRARAIVAALEREGIEVWWDQRLRAGDHFPPEIEAKVRAAPCVVVLWSVASTQSRWVRAEATIGANRGVLVPLQVEICEPPLEFTNLHTLDVSGWLRNPSQDITDELVASIRARIGQTEVAPHPKATDRVAELQRHLLMAPDSRALRAAAYEIEEITQRQPGNVSARLLHDDYREAIRRDEQRAEHRSYRMPSAPAGARWAAFVFGGLVILASIAIGRMFGYGMFYSGLLGLALVVAALLALALIPLIMLGAVSVYDWITKKKRRGTSRR